MNRREQLQDNYEDALFALLMDDIATIAGKEAAGENERLKNDPSFIIPGDVDKRCLQTMRQHFVKQEAYSVGHFTVKVMKRIVMVAGLAALLFTGAFAASETVRTNTLNLVVEVFETNTSFCFLSQPSDIVPKINVGWLPDRYTLKEYGYNNESTWYQYQKSEDEFIYIDYALTSGTEIGVDTEDAKIEHIEINGAEAMLIEKGTELQLVWATKENTAFITLISTRIGRDDLIHVANSLNY